MNKSFMGFLQRIQQASKLITSDQHGDNLAQKLDHAIGTRQLETGDVSPIESKQAHEDSASKLDIRRTTSDLAYSSMYRMMSSISRKGSKLPPYGDPNRDVFLDELWHEEPMLAGTVYSMSAKYEAMSWKITGRRLVCREAARMFAEAAHIDGWDWGGFISASAQDFQATNNGVFWETARSSGGDNAYTRLAGQLSEIGHIDSLCCNLTGNKKFPMWYMSEVYGQNLRFLPGEYVHFASLPSSRERYLGIGYCAVDRAQRAARLLLGLHNYDEEKLSNLPPEGVAAITGLTKEEFEDAIKLWMAERKKNNSLTFPQVLWLVGSQPGQEVKIAFNGFSQMPESFDRKTVVDQYACMLALDFGIDVREIWTIASGGGLGTAGESEIQHMKAKGKGPGEFLSTTERFLNAELPEDAKFEYDTQDIEEDANAAAIAKAWIQAYLPLYNMPKAGGGAGAPGAGGPNAGMKMLYKANPQPDKPNGEPNLPTTPIPGVNTGPDPSMGLGQPNTPQSAEQVIDKDQFLRLLADKGVIPDWLVSDTRTVVYDTDIHIKSNEGHPDDVTTFRYKGGILMEERLPAYVINSLPSATPQVPEANLVGKELEAVEHFLNLLHQKEARLRNIHGKPIPEQEVERGAAVTKRTIQAELERWRQDPLLSKYALTAEEEAQVLEMVGK